MAHPQGIFPAISPEEHRVTVASVCEPVEGAEPGVSCSTLNARALRLWAAPELILAITDLADEDVLLFHAIRQARRSAARVLLAHVLPRDGGRRTGSLPAGAGVSAQHAQGALDRMARQLRWVGIPCEPVLLRGDTTEEILRLAREHAVDRVLLTAWRDRNPLARTLAEEISPWVGVPVCVVRNGETVAGNRRAAGRIALALSLRSNCETQLAFACRLAQQHAAGLKVLHVFAAGEATVAGAGMAAMAERLPAGTLREAQLLCPVELAALAGDPAMAILNSEAADAFDFLLLGAPRSLYPDPGGAGVVHKVVGRARCPVMLLGHRTARAPIRQVLPQASVPG